MNSGPAQETMAESFADSQSQLTFADSEKRDLATGVPAPSLADSQLYAALLDIAREVLSTPTWRA